jgi:hypothetical protein
MHEIAHTIGVGTSSQWSRLISNNTYTGAHGKAALKEIDGPNAVLKGDNQHFWPYGLNYASEVKSNQDLINHCRIVDAIYKDLYPTGTIAFNQIPLVSSTSLTVRPGMSFAVFIASKGRSEAIVFSLAGQRVAGYSKSIDRSGEYPVSLDFSRIPAGAYVYRITAGDNRFNGKCAIIR